MVGATDMSKDAAVLALLGMAGGSFGGASEPRPRGGMGSGLSPIGPGGADGHGASREPPRDAVGLSTVFVRRHPDTGWTLMHYLAALGADDALAVLLSHPMCPVDMMSDHGSTPLDLALLRGHRVAARMLDRVRELRRLPSVEAKAWGEQRARARGQAPAAATPIMPGSTAPKPISSPGSTWPPAGLSDGRKRLSVAAAALRQTLEQRAAL